MFNKGVVGDVVIDCIVVICLCIFVQSLQDCHLTMEFPTHCRF